MKQAHKQVILNSNKHTHTNTLDIKQANEFTSDQYRNQTS